jgi:hypothetical protein
MQSKHTTHRTYLVRCWRERESANDGKPIWRFSVEEVLHKRQPIGFGDLDTLIAFLHRELDRGAEDENSNFNKEAT